MTTPIQTDSTLIEPRKCDAEGMCNALRDRSDVNAAKGFRPINTINWRTGDTGFLGVAYKTGAKDRGLMLNVCPFCCGKPGYFKRS